MKKKIKTWEDLKKHLDNKKARKVFNKLIKHMTLKEKIKELNIKIEKAQRDADLETVAELKYGQLPTLLEIVEEIKVLKRMIKRLENCYVACDTKSK